MSMRAVLVVGAVAVFAAGCGHLETHQAMLRPAEAPSGHTVELYMAEQPLPARPFYEIAIVQAVGFGDEAQPESVAHALTERAGRLGCDAVLRTFIDQGYTRAHATGVCVKWLGPSTAPSTAATALPATPSANPPPPKVRPAPAPMMEPLPSAGPGAGGGR